LQYFGWRRQIRVRASRGVLLIALGSARQPFFSLAKQRKVPRVRSAERFQKKYPTHSANKTKTRPQKTTKRHHPSHHLPA